MAYKKGLRATREADQMPKAAGGAVLEPAECAAQQVSRLGRCAQQADQLMAEVSGLRSVSLVRNRAGL